ncbi:TRANSMEMBRANE PROTEIN [Salix koriyanagi]|uniref:TRANSMEMBRANE PROTEIN n=1 Tax=Salix koriyanagi TaxID=2511006 RepID=A0A9Q0UXW3_9ROSI|nr:TRANSMEMBRANE PROTEIN [Salix koriyanagi]
MTSIDLSHNPLFSCIITLCTLILLYFPQAQKFSVLPNSVTEGDDTIEIKQSKDTHFGKSSDSCSLTHVDKWGASRCAEKDRFDPGPSPELEGSFVEWDVSAPLEVIHEEEEEEENPTRFGGLERYPSLSMYYPETDSDSDSDSDGVFSADGDWNVSERCRFKWEDEDREGLLIEIALDQIDNKKDTGSGLDPGSDFYVEEDNLIEIDISPAKNDELFPGEV